MTLYRQLVLVIAVLITLLFAGTLTVNFNSTRAFLVNQLESHAQDTATHLGLSLSPYMQPLDLPVMTSMVDAIFDRGYYREILLQDIDGKPLVSRSHPVVVEGVPDWFVGLVGLQAPRAEAGVMAGWVQAGRIQVQSHPGYAYQELWRTATRMVVWFLLAATLLGLLGAWALRVLLRPLAAVERQAEAVCARQYEQQAQLPRTRELRRVVMAMNRMTAKVKAMFQEQSRNAEHLRELAFLDGLTRLGNRRYFDSQLEQVLKDSEDSSHGALMLVQLGGLQEINDEHGYEAGDALLSHAGTILREALQDQPTSVLARLGGADFGVLAPEMTGEVADALGVRLCADLAQFHGENRSTAYTCHVGIMLYRSGDAAAELLSAADLALRAAQAQGPNAAYRHALDEATLPAIHGRNQWRAHFEHVLGAGLVSLHGQAVVNVDIPAQLLHREILVRIPDPEGSPLAAGIFMPMAEQLGVIQDLDRQVVEQALAHLAHMPRADAVAINLSLATLKDDAFLDWVLVSLKNAPLVRGKVYFEIPEFWAVKELERLRVFSTRLRELGHGLGLDHFGRGFSSFGYLQSLRPDYVKIDAAYTARVSTDPDDQFFVRTLSSVAHSLDIQAIAVCVEDQAQWDMLKSLQVDAIQGYVVSRPEPLENAD